MPITKRTVFTSRDRTGVLRFEDFAIVQTELGAMVEPFMANQRVTDNALPAFDQDDPILRIDDIHEIEASKRLTVLFGQDMALHGGRSSLS